MKYTTKEKTKLFLICNTCGRGKKGEWSNSFRGVVDRKQGCYSCNQKKYFEEQKIIESQIFFKRIKKLKKDKYDFSKSIYNGSEKLMQVYCNKCKKYFFISPSSLLHQGSDCNCYKQEKQEKTNLLKYGVKNPSQSPMIKKKKEKTTEKNYGVKNPSQSPIVREKVDKWMIDNWKTVPFEQRTEFKQYCVLVMKETRKNTPILKENHNGKDYYDNEDISEYFNLDYLDERAPQVDHIVSKLECFMKGISAEWCGSLENICYTKRIINMKKKTKINFPSYHQRIHRVSVLEKLLKS